MKRSIALLTALVLLFTLCPALYAASAVTDISGKSYEVGVRSIDQVTSLSGKFKALETFRDTGRKKNVRAITFTYDETEEKADVTGNFTEDAKIALVSVKGFDSALSSITDPELVVITVNGELLTAPEGACYAEYIGWQNVFATGKYGVVFPVELTREGSKNTYKIQVSAQIEKNGVSYLLTETAEIVVTLKNSHVYKDERTLCIASLEGENVDAYIVNDRIYLDYPSDLYYTLYPEEAPQVKITFSDEDGKKISASAAVKAPTCESSSGAILSLSGSKKLGKESCAVYDVLQDSTQAQRTDLVFALETSDAIYQTGKYTVVERRNITTDDPKGIVFAQSEKLLRVGESYVPEVLQVCDGTRIHSSATRTLTLLPGAGTDARVLDVDGISVTGTKPGVAYITARYETDLIRSGSPVTYDSPSMKITVLDEDSDVRTVLCRRLKVRAAASASSSCVGRLARGQQVVVVSEENGWALLSDGTYVYARYLN